MTMVFQSKPNTAYLSPKPPTHLRRIPADFLSKLNSAVVVDQKSTHLRPSQEEIVKGKSAKVLSKMQLRSTEHMSKEDFDRYIVQPIAAFAQASIVKMNAGDDVKTAIEATKLFKEWYDKGQAWRSDLLLETPKPNIAHLTDLEMLSRALLHELAEHGQDQPKPVSRRGFFRSTAHVCEDLVHKLFRSMACIAAHKAYQELVQASVSEVEEVSESANFMFRVLRGKKIWHPSEVFFHLQRLDQRLDQH